MIKQRSGRVISVITIVLFLLLIAPSLFSPVRQSSASKAVTCDSDDVQIIQRGVVNTTIAAIENATFSPGSGNKCGDTDASDADTSVGITSQCAVVPSCLVEINHVKVVGVQHNTDGDITLKVKDTTNGKVLIVEIMPQWQTLGLGAPVKGQFIDVTGYVFFDSGHHVSITSWEIHPVTWWQAS